MEAMAEVEGEPVFRCAGCNLLLSDLRAVELHLAACTIGEQEVAREEEEDQV